MISILIIIKYYADKVNEAPMSMHHLRVNTGIKTTFKDILNIQSKKDCFNILKDVHHYWKTHYNYYRVWYCDNFYSTLGFEVDDKESVKSEDGCAKHILEITDLLNKLDWINNHVIICSKNHLYYWDTEGFDVIDPVKLIEMNKELENKAKNLLQLKDYEVISYVALNMSED